MSEGIDNAASGAGGASQVSSRCACERTVSIVQLAALQVALRQHCVGEVEAAEVTAGERQARDVQARAVAVARGQQLVREVSAALEHCMIN